MATVTGIRALRPATALALLLALTACADRSAADGGTPGGTPSPTVALPADPSALVLQVSLTGGFVTPEMLAARLPVVSVYGDGRVISEGPVPAIYPGPALPNLQVRQIDRAGVQTLADLALEAGVDETADLGMPPIADVPSTRFTLVTAAGTHVREVYALHEGGAGIAPEQEAARAELRDLFAALTDLETTLGPDAVTPTASWSPEAVAAVVRPWTDPEDGLDHPEQRWPGPALPGEPLAGPGLGCALATGDQARVVLEAAGTANTLTPWVTDDGARWAVTFRPLLPQESGCADLGDA
ncbi:MAG TPA: hypothetical protein VHF92_08610 [Geodermatophilus sp.]|nr:hypothetical protein [Geodermatophilus sp.]